MTWTPARWRAVRAIGTASVLLVVMVAGTRAAAARQVPAGLPLDPVGYGVLALLASVLVLPARSDRAGGARLVLVLALVGGYLLRGYPYGPVLLAVSVAVFLLADRASARGSLYGVGFALVTLWACQVFAPGPGRSSPDAVVLAAESVALVLPPAWLGAIRQRARQAARAAVAEQRRRLGEERLDLAHEVHDLVAHHVSMVSIQAAAALRVLDQDPEQTREFLRLIRRSSTESLTDLRRAVAVMRDDGYGPPGGSGSDRAPGLAELRGLVTRADAGGVAVELTTAGKPVPVPERVGLVAYRVVQEALTNVVRHAPGASATVLVTYRPGELLVEVADTGRGRPAAGQPAAGAGVGLTGLRERAEVAGGRLEYGPGPAGGFRVAASLPLPAAPTDPADRS